MMMCNRALFRVTQVINVPFSVYLCLSLPFIWLNLNGSVIIKMILNQSVPVSSDLFVCIL